MKKSRTRSDLFAYEKDLEDVEDEKKLVELEDIFNFKVLNYIASGTFNCAHLIELPNGKQAVLRVAFLDRRSGDTERVIANRRIERGLEIVRIFNQFKNEFGPSLLQEVAPYKIVQKSQVSEEFMRTLCNSIKMRRDIGDYDLAMQKIEYLSGGTFNHRHISWFSNDEKICCIFSLLWYFAFASTAFGFSHKDFKPDNVVVRETEYDEEYSFSYQNAHWVFKSSHIPVVIDFDFASVATTTTPDDRMSLGTYNYAPPEAIILYYLHDTKQIDTLSSTVFTEIRTSYDWWALGMVILEMYVDIPYPFMQTMLKEYAEAAHNQTKINLELLSIELDYNESLYISYLAHMGYGLIIRTLVSKGKTLITECPPLFKTFDYDLFGEKRKSILERIIASRKYLQLVRDYERNVPLAVQSLLARLMHPDMHERSSRHTPIMFLHHPLFDIYRYETPHGLHFYEIPRQLKEDYLAAIKVNPRFPVLEACVGGCATKELMVCECCGHLYCGVECFETHHK